MFYEPHARGPELPHDPIKAIVAPRPIGWISALDRNGAVNLSPYSFFNMFSSRPAIVGFSSEGRKDAVTFVEESGEFVCNLVTYELREQMNLTSAPLPRGESEFAHAGLEMAESRIVKAPRVKAAKAALECKLVEVIVLRTHRGEALQAHLVLGEVVGVHIDDALIRDGRFDTRAARIISRAGYADYAVADTFFSLQRPPGGG
jgi:flavin reductase (DIM6/NTAB) family NADH-FMN oxidoreductase RutF